MKPEIIAWRPGKLTMYEARPNRARILLEGLGVSVPNLPDWVHKTNVPYHLFLKGTSDIGQVESLFYSFCSNPEVIKGAYEALDYYWGWGSGFVRRYPPLWWMHLRFR